MKHWLLVVCIFALAACGSPVVATPASTPQAINVIYPPSLQPWADRLSDCANNNPLVGVYFFPTAQPDQDIRPGQVLLELALSRQVNSSASLNQVGKEQVTVIVNQANPVSKLTTSDLRSIFSGQQSKWQDGSDRPIQVWVLPQNDPVRMVFDREVMQFIPLTTEAMLAPDPSAMLEAISNNIDAIGYLPASFLNSSGTIDPGKVNTVQLDSSLEVNLGQPVVAVTSGEPQGQLRSLLVCLESSAP